MFFWAFCIWRGNYVQRRQSAYARVRTTLRMNDACPHRTIIKMTEATKLFSQQFHRQSHFL
uniref:Uncharacterized protein n=1 Tax=Oryza brachyantha TaxID=4533 RepID=J3N7W4_ORYBR